jgi:menaquinone-dependent protoporphyrinogen oxidase
MHPLAAQRLEQLVADLTDINVRTATRLGAPFKVYAHYGFVKRHMMKRIAREKPGNLGTDTSRDYVYTEWDGVTRFAEDFLTYLAARAATTSS